MFYYRRIVDETTKPGQPILIMILEGGRVNEPLLGIDKSCKQFYQLEWCNACLRSCMSRGLEIVLGLMSIDPHFQPET